MGMENLKIKRMAQGKNTTLSHLYSNGIFLCYLLEDSIREKKIPGITCIPEGNYTLRLNQNAGMNTSYEKRYPSMHEGMIEICEIPNFSLVFIHIGNNHLETAGCPLSGRSFEYQNGDYSVIKSALAYEYVYPKVVEQLKKGNTNISVVNHLEL